MISYRTFRNDDPPKLLALWERCFRGRGTGAVLNPFFLDSYLLAKPYFRRDALLLAEEDNEVIGFILTGFAPTSDETALQKKTGIICLLGVHPAHRQKGIGSELLRRGEQFLTQEGASEIFAGAQSPWNPYTFGVYGGSQSPGFLESDPDASPFFQSQGYQSSQQALVMQRSIEFQANIVDRRFPQIRRDHDVRLHVPMRRTLSWFRECALGPVELMELTIDEKSTGQAIGRALAWDMELFSQHWNEHAIGIYDVEIDETWRRKGLARFLISQMMEYFHEQFFTLMETQIPADNTAALELFRGLGFEQKDVGHLYQRSN